jgi:hypothetical protein
MEDFMPNIPGTSRAQTTFLRLFRDNPAGPPAADWPSPAILRKWLRHDAFRRALDTLRDTLQFQADFQIARAASLAATRLAAAGDSAGDLSSADLKKLAELLRIAHLRHRFPTPLQLHSPATFQLRREIRDLEADIRAQDPDAPPTDDDAPYDPAQQLATLKRSKGLLPPPTPENGQSNTDHR